MPWMKKDLMALRGEFVHLVETELLLLATLCQRFGISCKTGYKWLARDRDEGRAGVAVTHSRPYHPQTLGKDERFHGTLTREVLRHAQWRDPAHVQTALDRWRAVYNQARPHEALGLTVPASRYQPSLRSYPEVLPPIEYDTGTFVRKVQHKGEFSFQGRGYKLSKAFRGYPVGVRPLAVDGQYEVLLCQHRLTTIDVRTAQSPREHR